MKTLNKIKYILTSSEKKRLILLMAGTLILSISETLSVGIIIPILGLYVDQNRIHTSKTVQWFYQLTGASDNKNFLTILIITAIVLFVMKSIYSLFILYYQHNITGTIRRRIKSEVLSAYLNKPYVFHLNNNSSVLFKNIINEVAEFCVGFLNSSMVMISEILVVSGIFLLLLIAYPAMTMAVISILLCVFIFFNYFLKNRIKKYAFQRAESGAQKYKTALEALNAVKEIQIHSVHEYFIRKFSDSLSQYMDGLVKYNILSNMPRYLLETLLVTLVLSGLLLSMSISKTSAELIPMVGVLCVALLRVIPSSNRIYSNYNNALYHQNSLETVYGIVSESRHGETRCLISKLSDENKNNNKGTIILNNISFSYDSSKGPVFTDLSLIVPPCNTVAFVGESGAGKSTLVDIIMGLLIPEKGIISYGNTVIDAKSLSEYRRKIGYVPQNIYLTDDTIEANIAFGIPDDQVDRKRLLQVIKIAQLENFIQSLPEDLKTMVGERGVKISGGQKQRIGIARALYRNPEILILDEATSALDGHTELELSNAVKDLSGHLTIIIIAHRLSTIKHADIIYVIEKGKVVDRGGFEGLIEKSSAFHKITNGL